MSNSSPGELNHIFNKYIATLFVHFILLIGLSFSGFFAIFAPLVNGRAWGIRFAKVAKFFADLAFWLVILAVLSNLRLIDWNEVLSGRWELAEEALRGWGRIYVSLGTYFYCAVGQMYFVDKCDEFINQLKKKQAEEKKGSEKNNCLLENWKNVELDFVSCKK